MRVPLTAAIMLALLATGCSANSTDTAEGGRVTTTSIGPPATTPTSLPRRVTLAVPDVDQSLSSVASADVVFDTFDGGFVTLAESDRELRERLLDVIPPIDHPTYEAADETDWLSDDDLVVGYVGADEQFAYPVRILNSHEIVNDVIDGVPVLISYCPLCRSAVVYDRRLDDRELSFSNTSALHESDLVMVDRETGSYWWQVAGSAIVGELTGSALRALPNELSTWASWIERHPGSVVLSRDTGFNRRYERDNFSRYDENVAAGRFRFPLSDNDADALLGAASIVVVVETAEQAYAYPIDALDGPFVDTLGDITIEVTPHGAGATAAFIGSDGTTTPAPTRTAFWFSIVRAFPDVEIRRP